MMENDPRDIKKDIEKRYLEMFNISEGKYVIGNFQEGITILNQQVRALNIFYSLCKTGVINCDPKQKIAIIGGGIAGITFAAAALKAGCSITIFEKESYYLHMQYGCDTRKIHPNLYNWPEKGSNYPDAGLPILNWRSDTASNVAKQIIQGFNNVTEELKKQIDGPKIHLYLREHFKCDIKSIKPNKPVGGISTHPFTVEFKCEKKVEEFNCDLVIYAIGYGLEHEKNINKETPSYWRNDSLSQTILDNKRDFVVSGLGDGGLIDFLRLKILNFSYEEILEYFSRKPAYFNVLIEEVLKVKHSCNEEKKLNLLKGQKEICLFEKFDNHIVDKYYDYVYKALLSEKRIRKDIEVRLHVRQKGDPLLKFGKVSILNALLTFILKKEENIKVIYGELTLNDSSKRFSVSGKELANDCTVITRHGTGKREVYTNRIVHLKKEQNKINVLAEIQESEVSKEFPARLWTYGELDLLLNRTKARKIDGLELPKTLKEISNLTVNKRAYITDDTISYASYFLAILFNLTKSVSLGSFRVSIHRPLEIDGLPYFQRIAPYFSVSKQDQEKMSGRIHLVQRGLVGLSIRSGKALRLINDGTNSYIDICRKLALGEKYSGDNPKFNSSLAIPVMAIIDNVKVVNLVILFEAFKADFFTDSCVKQIIAATIGFVYTVDESVSNSQIKMAEVDFKPLLIKSNFKLGDFEKYNLKTKQWSDRLKPLVFKSFYSFDIVINNLSEKLSNFRLFKEEY